MRENGIGEHRRGERDGDRKEKRRKKRAWRRLERKQVSNTKKDIFIMGLFSTLHKFIHVWLVS